MRSEATQATKLVPTWDECEILLFVWCRTFCCSVCDVKVEWHSHTNGLKNIVSLQHNDDGTMSFICLGCNAAHGPSKLGDDYLKIPIDKKYCYKCNRILYGENFHKDATNRDGLDSKCKKCKSSYDKKRHRGILGE